MRKRLILGLTLGTGAILIGFVSRDRLEAKSGHSAKLTAIVKAQPVLPFCPIEPLDSRIQQRFQATDGFGMNRMPVVPQHFQDFPERFHFESAEEQTLVVDLLQQGWTVGLYLGGRGLLRTPMNREEWNGAEQYSARRAISKPILISGDPATASFPEP